ncbi:hypothetical protein DOM22_10955 [Bdellovibrio sp. ZAP7]|uniref:hypothetical protein n=1 Tax=Bdellovibrio sp. ZAP7 TaxID=2231053 RepID=UPI001159DF50|nr:hypothetical protein [Bdellovibrio sp. ZAP7]QDK45630.1 hypothetical protein DOM22_10955 [Bdellovibrio sp. ZAP7]
MNEIKLEDNIVIHSYLHDAEIVGVEYNRFKDKNLILTCISSSDVNFKLIFLDVVEMSCFGFQTQNVILNVQYFNDDAPEDVINEARKSFEIGDEKFKVLLKLIKETNYSLFNVFPSVGCEVFVIAHEVRIDLLK